MLLDPLDILAALGIDHLQALDVITGGTDTLIWKVRYEKRDYALRVFRRDQADGFNTEIAAMQTAIAHGIPVPQIYATTLWQERPAMLISWLQGEPVFTYCMKHPTHISRVMHAFGEMQAKIHRTRAAPNFPAPDWILRAGDKLIEDALRAQDQHNAQLLHFDYHPYNVLTDGEQITGVIDWTNATVGDPRADYARTYTILKIEPVATGLKQYPIAIGRAYMARAWMQGYQSVIPAYDTQEMSLFYAWAGAYMARDLARHLDNPRHWFGAQQMAHIHTWTERYKHHAQLV